MEARSRNSRTWNRVPTAYGICSIWRELGVRRHVMCDGCLNSTHLSQYNINKGRQKPVKTNM